MDTQKVPVLRDRHGDGTSPTETHRQMWVGVECPGCAGRPRVAGWGVGEGRAHPSGPDMGPGGLTASTGIRE